MGASTDGQEPDGLQRVFSDLEASLRFAVKDYSWHLTCALSGRQSQSSLESSERNSATSARGRYAPTATCGRLVTVCMSQPRESSREMVSGESHYFLGNRYRLRVIPDGESKQSVIVRNKTTIELHFHPGADVDARQRLLARWYRVQLRELLAPLMEKWQERLGVQATAYGIEKMKTNWGTCNTETRRVWINLELAKKSSECIEYVVAHELAHLLVRHHDDAFLATMDDLFGTKRTEEQNLLPWCPTNLAGKRGSPCR